ncbi:hypothetical protein NZD89_10350 [Alicyclobacillus fastidiosus]|uniref:Spore coat protein D n=1 Tax=Alicyclobacillus fastidiosus TaxID=392011 RepID=A0ABY6ZNJ7_9BACL|nr:hypothetical protein [Alicyclobacillus fastidiosus]WAH43746.1 hypothetical protein NZD89_10350 [Alicyclobacillus fastidiosus]GMA59964.1 hypothetical protein GCM10025859_04040 [Alicyclobacillus fastidiosus]
MRSPGTNGKDGFGPPLMPVPRPIIYVDRYIYVDIPRHYYVPVTRRVVVEQGHPAQGHEGRENPSAG